MLTGKQRSFLKGIANTEKAITQIGKAGITDSFIEQLDLALEAREIVKVNILETSLLDTKETANKVADILEAEFVQSIGNKFVIYRKSKNNPKIQLPKS
ncbi:YhbY family RNA-binding protein [Alkaliphilus serpentinus]|uniref:YhbY family RNA-binding protein n=1 Tax=Alkaliphilus serpentinus TaxID=1482731 RepID=A0A833HRD6_9FIRM|nr:YhbY family RNA-binding protein [Alkaliphilus serpentinus]KAB3533120.1 YhbY family RNA-binding protein [Alkaliphilus serpentinus]